MSTSFDPTHTCALAGNRSVVCWQIGAQPHSMFSITADTLFPANAKVRLQHTRSQEQRSTENLLSRPSSFPVRTACALLCCAVAALYFAVLSGGSAWTAPQSIHMRRRPCVALIPERFPAGQGSMAREQSQSESRALIFKQVPSFTILSALAQATFLLFPPPPSLLYSCFLAT